MFLNQPSLGTLVTNGVISSDGWWYIEITGAIEAVSEISVCLYAPNASDEAYIYSSEYSSSSYHPYVEWIYEAMPSVPVDPWLVIACIALATMLIGYKIEKSIRAL